MPTVRNSEQARRLAEARWRKRREREAEEAAGVSATNAPESIASARARRVRALADRAEVEAARLRGDLIERAKVERAIFEFARRYRDALLAWPARIAATLAARLGADPHAVEAALVAEVHQHLEELARDPLPRVGGPGAG